MNASPAAGGDGELRPIRLVRLGGGSRTAVPHHRGVDLRLPPHPAAPDPADLGAVRDWIARVPGPTAIDLFAGAGGLSLGLRDAGFSVLLGADSDRAAARTHHHNIGGLVYDEDLSDPTDLLDRLDAWGIGTVDLVAGGFPCQPFSRAGRSMIRHLVEQGARSRVDARATLWRSFVAVVTHLRPRAVLIENVPDLAAWDDGALVVDLCESLREIGYEVDARVLNAWEYGVPQHRRRLFLVGLREELPYAWPEPSSTVTTLRDAIGDLPVVGGGQRREELPYVAPPMSQFQVRMRTGAGSALYDHITRAVRPDDAEAFALLREGQTYEDLPSHLQRYRNDIFTDKYKRLSWNELSRTITAHIAKDGYWYIHPAQDRTLSVREAARIQTFPDWFRFAGHPTLRYRQIGNAVPPLLGEAVGRSIVTALEARGQPVSHSTASEFREELLAWHALNRRHHDWRRGRDDPWIVLLAELLLRRTTGDRSRAIVSALRKELPSPSAVEENPAAARRALVDLGLATRVSDVLAIASRLVADHGGCVPEIELELEALPGLGDYTVSAVRTFAFDRPAVLLDRPTSRVMTRVNGHDDYRRWQVRLDLFRLAGPTGPDRAFNDALLDLAGSTCLTDEPRCDACPVSRRCATGQNAAVPASSSTCDLVGSNA